MCVWVYLGKCKVDGYINPTNYKANHIIIYTNQLLKKTMHLNEQQSKYRKCDEKVTTASRRLSKPAAHTHTHTRTPSNITEQCSKCIYADNNTVITHSIGNRVKQKWLWLYCLDYSKAKPEWLLNTMNGNENLIHSLLYCFINMSFVFMANGFVHFCSS